MYDPELLISLYFNGNGFFEKEHMDQLSKWIQRDPANAAKFVHAAFIHRAIHDSLAGQDIQRTLLQGIDDISEDSDMFWDADAIIPYEKKIEAVQKKFEDWENKADGLMLISASVGMPPFYVVSFVAGALKLHYIRFLIAGIIGRSIRFAAIVYFPQLVLKYI